MASTLARSTGIRIGMRRKPNKRVKVVGGDPFADIPNPENAGKRPQSASEMIPFLKTISETPILELVVWGLLFLLSSEVLRYLSVVFYRWYATHHIVV